MSDVARVAATAAMRRVATQKNPELLKWARSRWGVWLNRQREFSLQPSDASLIASAAIACLADLDVHIGLMQLLTTELTLKLILSLPTEEAARIARAQARRDEWEGFVQIVTDSERCRILDGLPDCAAVACFRTPAVISATIIEKLLCAPHPAGPSGENLAAGTNAFLGSIAHYRVWRGRDAPGLAALTSLQEIIQLDPSKLSAASLAPQRSGHRKIDVEALNATTESNRGRITLPAVEYGDQLLVEATDARPDATVLVRRYAELCRSDQLNIRAPVQLLTTSPRKISVHHLTTGKSQRTELLFNVPPSRLRPWMIAAFLNRGGGGNPVIRGFAKGVGCRIAYAEDEPERLCDIPVVWGVLRDSDRIVAQAKAQELYFFYIDHAYFNRGHGHAYRITRNGYEAGPIRKCADDRLQALDVALQPWRKAGREIIVCPPTDYFMKAHDCADWLEVALAQLKQITDRPIIIREKPKPGETVVPLPQALSTAHALVTHSSNVAIEAACLGTPVFVSPTSAAASIGRTDLADVEKPVYPDRAPWLAHLAYNQFSFDEICDGTAWRLLLELEEREFA